MMSIQDLQAEGPAIISSILLSVEELSRTAGCTVLAYVNHIYILSGSGDMLNNIDNFFSERDTALHLNMTLSSTNDLNTVREHGTMTLGTMVGSRSARYTFLKSSQSKWHSSPR